MFLYLNVLIPFTGVKFEEFKRNGKENKPLKKAHTISLSLDHGPGLSEERPLRLANTQTEGGNFWCTMIV